MKSALTCDAQQTRDAQTKPAMPTARDCCALLMEMRSFPRLFTRFCSWQTQLIQMLSFLTHCCHFQTRASALYPSHVARQRSHQGDDGSHRVSLFLRSNAGAPSNRGATLHAFLAPVLEIPSSSLHGTGFFHGTPGCVAKLMVVKVALNCGFQLLLKSVEGLPAATEQPAPEVPLQATSIRWSES